MDDLISRQAAINAIDECYCGGEDSCGEPWIYKENAVEAIQMIEPIPPAEPKKIKGEWVGADTQCGIACSVCGVAVDDFCHSTDYIDLDYEPNFCPNCGAEMRGGHDD